MDYLNNLLGAFAVAVTDLQGTAVDPQSGIRTDAEALLAVHARPRSTVADVAATTGLTHSGAVRAVDRLAVRGWVERTPGADRRTVQLRCTPVGKRQAVQILERRAEGLQNLTRTLSPERAAHLATAMEELLSRMPRTRADAWRICRLCDHGVCGRVECPVGNAVP